MLALDRSHRTWLGGGALVCFVAAVALAPSEVRSRLGPPPIERGTARPGERSAIRAFVPVRDPFAPRADIEPAPPPPVIPRPAPLGALPANAGAGVFPFPLATKAPPRIAAIVVGPHPTAIVEDASGMRAVTAGDLIDGAAVRAIDADGIELSGGRRLMLAPAGGPEQP
jgi:hypothetical protein